MLQNLELKSITETFRDYNNYFFPFEFSRKELLIEKSLFMEKAIFKLFEEKCNYCNL